MNNYKVESITWPDNDREDIARVSQAQQLGFDILTSYRFKDGTQIPHNALSFERKGIRVWFSFKNTPHWRAATLIEGRYVNHRTYTELAVALSTESFY